MSIHITLSNDAKPQVLIRLSDDANATERNRLEKLSQILHTGLTSLGSLDYLPEENAIFIHNIRTRCVSDDDESSAIGAGDEDLSEKIDSGYEVDDYTHIYDETTGRHKTRVVFKPKGSLKPETLDVARANRHAPLIDGIYATLLLAQGFFPKHLIKFAVTDSGKALLEGVEAVDATCTDNATTSEREPTFAYLKKLHEALKNKDNRGSNKRIRVVQKKALRGKEHQESQVEQYKGVEVDATVYDGKKLFEHLKKNYIDNKQRKRIWEVFKNTTKTDFMAYYAPIDEVIAECHRLIKLESGSIPKKER